MSEAHNPRVGIIADSTLQRHIMCQAVQSAGYDIAVTLGPERVDDELITGNRLDLWLIEIDDEDTWSDLIDDMFEKAHAPILFSDGQAPALSSRLYPRWQRRIYAKVKEIVGPPQKANATVDVVELKQELEASQPELTLPPGLVGKQQPGEPAEYIWVIGASLGGPKAVKEFLDALPAGLPLAFVIAQHIDAGFHKTLKQVWGRHTPLTFIDPVEGDVISHGEVVIAPVEQVMLVDDDSRIRLLDEPWEGPYSPSIDQIMNLMLDSLGVRTAAILFSGMGNDGSIAGPRMQSAGVQVWAQNAETCACSSMPDSARTTGCVSFSGTPQALAAQVVRYAQQHLVYDQPDNES